MRRSFAEKHPILSMQVDSRILIVLFPVIIALGKVVRWTVMRATLVDYSKGWAWVDTIMTDEWSWEFFGVDEVAEGDIGQGDNIYSFFRAFWVTIWARLPESFQEFEFFITLTFGLLFMLVLLGMRRRLTLIESLFICLCTGVISVYCLCLSKEPFQLVFFLLMYALLRSSKIPERFKFAGACSIVLLSTVSFRSYYLLIIVFALVCRWFLNRQVRPNRPWRTDAQGRLRWLAIIKIYGLAVLVYFVMMAVFSVANTDLYERFQDALLYASDDTSSSNTYMENLLAINEDNPSVLSVTLEYALVVLRLLFPLELLAIGPKYWPYVVYQLCMTVFLLRGLRNVRSNSLTQNAALTIFVGYVFASATFEVDFGAWVRHCAVTTPIVLLMSGICLVKKPAEPLREREASELAPRRPVLILPDIVTADTSPRANGSPAAHHADRRSPSAGGPSTSHSPSAGGPPAGIPSAASRLQPGLQPAFPSSYVKE